MLTAGRNLDAFATADLHLTDNPLDEYRWRFLDWLGGYLKRKPCKVLYILGDVTDRKDRHSGEFINKVANRLVALRMEARLDTIVVVKGNHDYSVPSHPTMGFLNYCPGVLFVSDSYSHTKAGGIMRILAHQQDENFFKSLRLDAGTSLVLMHQSVKGVKLSNGTSLNTGVNASVFRDVTGPVVSGDIHVPQTIGKVTYTGSPYPVKFGDDFQPRILRIYQEGRGGDVLLESHPVPSISRTFLDIHSLDDLGGVYIAPGDQVKIRYYCGIGGRVDWEHVKDEASGFVEDHGATVVGAELYHSKDSVEKQSRAIGRRSMLPTAMSRSALVDEHGEESDLDEYLVRIGKEFIK